MLQTLRSSGLSTERRGQRPSDPLPHSVFWFGTPEKSTVHKVIDKCRTVVVGVVVVIEYY